MANFNPPAPDNGLEAVLMDTRLPMTPARRATASLRPVASAWTLGEFDCPRQHIVRSESAVRQWLPNAHLDGRLISLISARSRITPLSAKPAP